jgi:hypothetical protein
VGIETSAGGEDGVSRAAYQRRSIAILVSASAMLLALAACASTYTVRGSTLDGWTVGEPEACPPPNFAAGEAWPAVRDCAAITRLWLETAKAGFDRRDPGHPEVARMSLYTYGGTAKFIGCWCYVAVLELVDGSIRAIGIGHLGVDHEHVVAFDDGPDD